MGEVYYTVTTAIKKKYILDKNIISPPSNTAAAVVVWMDVSWILVYLILIRLYDISGVWEGGCFLATKFTMEVMTYIQNNCTKIKK